ncbi:MAG TPA: adenylate/guanylate cyclase domain-containing protein [Gaiellaceae bacterium]|nr:adenylate/guanylate cyclase domain-containing protein [Gaiellaceae bacterium]
MPRAHISINDALSTHRLHWTRHLMRMLPHSPRCKLCNAPFAGAGRVLLRPTPYRPSRMNPNLCAACFDHLPLGGAELDIGVLFADVRGFTTLAESRPPAEVERRLDRFYRVASDVVVRHDGLVDKLVGDAVMALFLPVLVEADACATLVAAGEGLLHELADDTGDDALAVGVGVDFGTAFVGNVGPSDLAKDFTAIGDVVNVASRLQEAAGPGELVVSERVWSALPEREAQVVELELKGKSAPVRARVVRVAA